MTIETIPYHEYLNQIPQKGNCILAQQTEKEILVYQAFNHQISDYAIKNQKFGGPHYSFSRMTWIKPNFLWMMYRCGWAEKLNQERVLGIWITKKGFTKILEEAVFSSFQQDVYANKEAWKAELHSKKVRLQWDPDHNIYGQKQERRAIQLGLKNEIRSLFNQEMIVEIVDLTVFVKEQKSNIKSNEIEELRVPKESIFAVDSLALRQRLKLKEDIHSTS